VVVVAAGAAEAEAEAVVVAAVQVVVVVEEEEEEVVVAAVEVVVRAEAAEAEVVVAAAVLLPSGRRAGRSCCDASPARERPWHRSRPRPSSRDRLRTTVPLLCLPSSRCRSSRSCRREA
jgi:hypothetical protein